MCIFTIKYVLLVLLKKQEYLKLNVEIYKMKFHIMNPFRFKQMSILKRVAV